MGSRPAHGRLPALPPGPPPRGGLPHTSAFGVESRAARCPGTRSLPSLHPQTLTLTQSGRRTSPAPRGSLLVPSLATPLPS